MSFSADNLKIFPEFNLLSDDEREKVYNLGEVIVYNPGDQVFKSGDIIENMQCLIAGEIDVEFMTDANVKNYATVKAGDINGVLPFSRMREARGESVVRETGAIVFRIHKSKFPQLVCLNYDMVQHLVGRLIDRSREGARFVQQQEKLISLGKLSAGLAHELNNPAGAMVRSSSELKKHLGSIPDKFKKVMQIKASDAEVDAVSDLLFGHLTSGFKRFTPIEQNEREEALFDWFDDHGINYDPDWAYNFVSIGITPVSLDDLIKKLQPQGYEPILNWMDNNITTERLVSEIEEAAKRISALIGNIKSYSHMDRANDFEATQLREGIESTLQLMKYKLRTNKVEVDFFIPEKFPQAWVRPGEINQVFTNLIDNAIDAMPNGGKLTIRGEYGKSDVTITIKDNGPGIPESIKTKVFDPFFTTKEVGKGTGLGLDIARKIILAHKGAINFTSSSTEGTEFWICLPQATITHQQS